MLRSLYDEMMPLCEDMASVAKGVAGIGALFYVAYRVWQSLARAEEIDVFPLFRPFVLGLCIMFFPTLVLGTINEILSPVCSATSSLVEQQTFDMKKYQEEKDELEREAMLRFFLPLVIPRICVFFLYVSLFLTFQIHPRIPVFPL